MTSQRHYHHNTTTATTHYATTKVYNITTHHYTPLTRYTPLPTTHYTTYIVFLYCITRIRVLHCLVVNTLRRGWNSVPPVPFWRFNRTQQSKDTSELIRYSVWKRKLVRTPVITARPVIVCICV